MRAGDGRLAAWILAPAAAEFDENTVTLDWYDYLLLGKQNEFANGKPVRIFVMGENEWRYEDDVAAEARQGDAVSSCIPAVRRTAWMATAMLSTAGCAAKRMARTGMFMIRRIRCLRWVGLCAAIGQHLAGRDRGISVRLRARSDVLVYSTPPLDAGYGSDRAGDAGFVCEVFGSGYGLYRRSWWMWGRMALRII